MKITTSKIVAMAAMLLSTVSGLNLPSCGASNCLRPTGRFNSCAPANLSCICDQPQAQIFDFTETVKPCLDSPDRKKYCTDGASVQYQDLLTKVCEKKNKTVDW